MVEEFFDHFFEGEDTKNLHKIDDSAILEYNKYIKQKLKKVVC